MSGRRRAVAVLDGLRAQLRPAEARVPVMAGLAAVPGLATLGQALATGLAAGRDKAAGRGVTDGRAVGGVKPGGGRSVVARMTPEAVLAELDRIKAGLPVGRHQPTVKAARRLNRAAGMLAGSVLLDSFVEHYRGSFKNKAMYTPLVVSAATLGVSAHGTSDARPMAHGVRDTVYAGAAVTGVVGTGFHVYNVMKRPGGMAWQNLFYGAPLGAPMAVLLAGLLGFYSERVRETSGRRRARVFGLPAGRALAAMTGVGLLGTAGEAGLLHFRGAYHDPFMFLPVTVPPVAAVLAGEAALGPVGRDRWFTRAWLRGTMVLGFVGVGFHAWGVHRNMGGWRNWRQTVLNGPPLPAPPSFTGLAMAGLAALGLMQEHPDA